MANNWNRVFAVLAAGATAAAALTYLLIRDDDGAKKKEEEEQKKKLAKELETKQFSGEMSREKVITILEDISKSQEKMKDSMKKLTADAILHPKGLQEVYNEIKKVYPADPLLEYNLTLRDLDKMLEQHQNDAVVSSYLGRIMGIATSAPGELSESAKGMTVEKCVEIHQFMLNELEALVQEHKTLKHTGEIDARYVTIAAQVIIGAKVEKKFNAPSDDLENAVMHHHAQLSTHAEFNLINIRLQATMSQLIQ